ncbi:MAG: nucleoid-associated protein [Chitinophagaceae bacterium]
MDFKSVSLKKIILHYVGNKNNAEPLQFSKKELQLPEETIAILQDSLLAKFKTNHEYHSFHHPSSLQYNEVYNYCKEIFRANKEFTNASQSIAEHLFKASTHPKVKGGEFYVAFFEGLPVEGRMHQAIGIFKTENKSFFIEVPPYKGNFSLQLKEGVEINKIDKGCLIIDRNEESGYDVVLHDAVSRGEEATYWKETFLGVNPQKNDYHHTTHLLNLTRQFITGGLEEEASKKEQVELLNRSLDYFKTKDSFDIEEFQKEVFEEEEIIQSFRKFGSHYVATNDYDIAAGFDISGDALKKGIRQYKSVLKLDKNFHIYIHGRTDLLEKGTEDDGRKYYKIYYQQES